MTAPAHNFDADLAMLRWLVELGVDEAICDSPIDRTKLPSAIARTAVPAGARRASSGAGEPAPAAGAASPTPPPPTVQPDAHHAAEALAAACMTLDDLRAAIENFDGCALKLGARNIVFADGNPAARLMIIGEAPGREEDQQGRPFVGASGQLLDRMLAAIGLSRDASDPDHAVYITNVLPWRPPQNRDPSGDEAALMLPFVRRHIELAQPQVLLLLGNAPIRALLGASTGITRLRGQWHELLGRPALPTLHPAGLLRNPINKRLVWADLLSLSARLSQEN